MRLLRSSSQRHAAYRVYQTLFTVACACGRTHWATATFLLSLN